MFNLLSLLFSIGTLAFILRYRIHVHVVYSSSRRDSRPRAKSAGSKACPHTRTALPISGRRAGGVSQSSEAPTVAMTRPVQDLASALVNLGASKASARAAALRAYQQAPNASFDELVRIAIQEAA